jgi:spore coat-associated protein N
VTDEVRAADRFRWLRRTMSMWLLTVALLVVALAVGVTWSAGLLSSASANPRNVVAAGSMSQVNSADNAAIMGAVDLLPGDTVEGTVTIRNAGDAQGDFVLTVQDVVDDPGPAGGTLSATLHLRVIDTGSGRRVYDGQFDELDISLGTWLPDEERTYRFVVSFPESASGTDDDYQFSKFTATFEWNAIQSH